MPDIEPLSYASTGGPGAPYTELRLPDGPIYFPMLCCDCLVATKARDTIRGNRIRHRSSLVSMLVGAATEAKDFFEIKMPVCNACWRAYRHRRRIWMWIGPAIGASLGLAAGVAIAMTLTSALGERLIPAFILTVGGAICGFPLNHFFVPYLSLPPARVHLYQIRKLVGIRFRNRAYVEPFLTAQATAVEVAAQRLVELEGSTPEPEAAAWYYLEEGKTIGPVTLEDIRRKVADGELGPASKLWTEGKSEWIAASKVPGLM